MVTKRYMDEKILDTWIIKPAKYEERNGVIIPTQAKVFWRLKEVDFSYANINVQKIANDMAKRF